LYAELPGRPNRNQRRELFEAAVTVYRIARYGRGVRVAGLIGLFSLPGK
jgi:hypothetical protein